MAAVAYLLGRLIDQKGGTINILAAVALGAVGHTPVSVVDSGFLLSFCGHARHSAYRSGPAINVSGGPVVGRSGCCNRLFATVAAEVALAPVAALLFSRVTFAGLFLNFAAIPLMTIVQIGSMVTLVLSTFNEGLASAAGYAVHVAATWLVESARLKDAAPWLSVTVLPPSAWLVVAYYVSVVVAIASARFRRHALASLTLALGLLLAGIGAPREVEEAPRDALRVVFLDVGQGDATLVRFPDRRAYLIDAGGLPAAAPIDTPEPGPSGVDIGTAS